MASQEVSGLLVLTEMAMEEGMAKAGNDAMEGGETIKDV